MSPPNLPPTVQESSQNGGGTIVKAGLWEKGWGRTVSSGQARAMEFINSQWLWLPAQEPHTVKPVSKSTWNEPRDWADNLLTVGGSWGWGRINFLSVLTFYLSRFFFYLGECVVNKCPQRSVKETDSLELESQAGPNCSTWALGFELWSYGEAMMNS